MTGAGVVLPLSVAELAVMSDALDTAAMHLADGGGLTVTGREVDRLKEKVNYLLWALEDSLPSDPGPA